MVLVGVVVDRGEDAVGRVRAVLVGRVHRHVAVRLEARRMDVEAGVEALGVAVARAASPLTIVGLPAVGGQLARQGARDDRRTAPREEHQGGEHARHAPVLPEDGRFSAALGTPAPSTPARPPASVDAVRFARAVAQPPGADERGRAAAVEVDRLRRAERDQRARRAPRSVSPASRSCAPVAGDGEQPVARRAPARRADSGRR